MHNFLPLPETKAVIKIKPERVFDSVYSYRKLRGSSLTFSIVVLYLKLFENIDQISIKAHFLLLLD